jgi:uncharacterized protein DUF1883
MQFIHHDLGFRRAGEIVEITLSGNAANVRLMDSMNSAIISTGSSIDFMVGLRGDHPFTCKFRIREPGTLPSICRALPA